MDEDDVLLERAVAQDHAALATLLQRHGGAVRSQLRIESKWTAAVDADDAMQVTYLEAFLQFGKFKPQGVAAFAGWLRRIAENNLRDAIKELERAKRPPADKRIAPPRHDESVTAFIGLLGVTITTASQVASERESTQAFDDAVKRLPADYAAAVQLYDLEARPISEVAAKMGRSPGAVHMLRNRAHEQLRELLGAQSQIFSRGS